MFGFLTKIFGSKREKDLNQLRPYVEEINSKYKEFNLLSNDQIRNEVVKLKEFYSNNISKEREECKLAKDNLINNNSIDKVKIRELQLNLTNAKKKLRDKSEKLLMEMLTTAFAIAKDTARRFTELDEIVVTETPFDRLLISENRDYIKKKDNNTVTWLTSWDVMGNRKKWNMIHFDVQLMGGIVLHQGKIAEMATGEGKTLVATLAVFLNALTGDGVHLVTVNDYLSRRDYYLNRPFYEFLGLTIGCLDITSPGSVERRNAYLCDIVYGTNNEFGFDYLRDNMAFREEDCVQRENNYAIIDEVDSVLIDDSRTPLIMSGDYSEGDVEIYKKLQPEVKKLVEAQTQAVNLFLLKAKDRISKNEKDEETGLALFRAYRGYPKYRPLVKFLSEPGIKLFLEKTESTYLENNSQRMPEVDQELYFYVEEKFNNVELTDKGYDFLSVRIGDPDFFILPDVSIDIDRIDNDPSISDEAKKNMRNKIFKNYSLKTNRIHVVQQLLKAYTLFEKNVDYVVLDNRVLIVDESTGRKLEGRRYSDGLHQALEAKEHVEISNLTKTYATITLQNYFRLYNKLAGMTGTAELEAAEFWDIYKLDVVQIPPNKKIIREDKNDIIYKTKKVKLAAIVEKIVELSKAGRPVLVGTTSVDDSEMLSRMLSLKKIKHQILNAKYHEKEAEIIAHAGESGTVTIATNMAGRGTDIKLDKKALEAGGLAIIGTERHNSRRIDKQLRGRAGRQGDPGSSQIYMSFEDNLLRRTVGIRRAQMFIDSLKDDEVIDSPLVTKTITSAQKKEEENDFGYRKRLLEYDDVLNKQRSKIYEFRKEALKKEIINSDVFNMIWSVVKNYILLKHNDEIQYEDVKRRYKQICNFDYPESVESFEDKLDDELLSAIYEDFVKKYKEKCIDIDNKIFDLREPKNRIYKFSVSDDTYNINVEADLVNNKFENVQLRSEYLMRLIISNISIFFIDTYWQKHLQKMDDLKKSVQNAYYEQNDPLVIFKFESYELFVEMLVAINCDIIKFVFTCNIDHVESQLVDDNISIVISKKNETLSSFRKKMKSLTNG